MATILDPTAPKAARVGAERVRELQEELVKGFTIASVELADATPIIAQNAANCLEAVKTKLGPVSEQFAEDLLMAGKIAKLSCEDQGIQVEE